MLRKYKNGEPREQSIPKSTQEVYRSTELMDQSHYLIPYGEPTSTPALKKHGSEELLVAGVFHGGEEWVPPGVFHGGEEWVPPGVFHNTSNGAGLLSRFVSSVKQLFYETPDLPPSEIWYRTARGSYNFNFRFCWQKQYYEIDILKTPSYQSRSDDLHSTHRLPSKRGGYKICVKDNSKVNSLQQAKIYCALWAEATARYIETGKTF